MLRTDSDRITQKFIEYLNNKSIIRAFKKSLLSLMYGKNID